MRLVSATWMKKPMADRYERDLGQELGQRVGGGAPLERLRGHVELLLDDAGADRGERDHERDDLEVARLAQQPDGLLAADALLLGGDGAAPAGRGLPRTISRTSPAHSGRMTALQSSRLSVPPGSRRERSRPAPVMPPRLEPPPMKPKTRLACRGS